MAESHRHDREIHVRRDGAKGHANEAVAAYLWERRERIEPRPMLEVIWLTLEDGRHPPFGHSIASNMS